MSPALPCSFSSFTYVLADQIPPPSKPIVLHINISAVNVTWSWQGYNDIQFLVQVAVGPSENFVNTSKPNGKYYLIYGDMNVNEVYLFRVFAIQNGIYSEPSLTSDLLINGVNGECSPELEGMKLLENKCLFICQPFDTQLVSV